MSFDAKKAVQKLPRKPGVYQFFDQEGTVIYVGKAKNLRNRVGSYFKSERSYENGKTRVLAGKIREIRFTLVDTEIRSEEHTSELQSLMRISYAVFCLKKKTHIHTQQNKYPNNS